MEGHAGGNVADNHQQDVVPDNKKMRIPSKGMPQGMWQTITSNTFRYMPASCILTSMRLHCSCSLKPP